MSDLHQRTPDPLIRRVLAGLLLWLAIMCAIAAPPHPNGLTILTVALAGAGVWLLRADLDRR